MTLWRYRSSCHSQGSPRWTFRWLHFYRGLAVLASHQLSRIPSIQSWLLVLEHWASESRLKGCFSKCFGSMNFLPSFVLIGYYGWKVGTHLNHQLTGRHLNQKGCLHVHYQYLSENCTKRCPCVTFSWWIAVWSVPAPHVPTSSFLCPSSQRPWLAQVPD